MFLGGRVLMGFLQRIVERGGAART
jgi:hypothetical protein